MITPKPSAAPANESQNTTPSSMAGAPSSDRSARNLLAWLALVFAGLPLAFYIGGALLTLGFFFSLGLTSLTVFSPTELALAGWLRIAGNTFLIIPILVIATVVAWPVSSAIADKIMMKRPQLAIVILSALVALGCTAATVYAGGVLQGLLAAVAALLFLAFTFAFATKREQVLQENVRSLRWPLLVFFLSLAFAALGEVSFVEAMEPRHPPSMRVKTSNDTMYVRPLLLGTDRLIYEYQGAIFISDYESKYLLRVGSLGPLREGKADGSINHS